MCADMEKTEGRMEGKRGVVVSALQFACTDDVPTNLDTAERFLSSFLIVDMGFYRLFGGSYFFTIAISKLYRLCIYFSCL